MADGDQGDAAWDELLLLLAEDAADVPLGGHCSDSDVQSSPACRQHSRRSVFSPSRLTSWWNETADESSHDDSTSNDAEDTKDPAMVKTKLVAARSKRRSQKNILASLRDEVSRLTLQLVSLKTAAGIDNNTPVARIPDGSSTVLDECSALGSHSLWKALAERQRHRRLHSEHDNRMLRMAIDLQARRAKQLQRLIRKRALEEVGITL